MILKEGRIPEQNIPVKPASTRLRGTASTLHRTTRDRNLRRKPTIQTPTKNPREQQR